MAAVQLESPAMVKFKTYKRVWFLLCIAYFAGGYLLLNWLSQTRPRYYNVGFSFEQDIPFIGYFIFGYLLIYVCVVGIYFLINDEEVFKRAVKMFFALTTLHFIFFIVLPVKMMLRPEVPPEDGIIGEIVKLYYFIDRPYNCFPSLHVAYTFLGTLLLWNYKRGWAYLYLAATIIVSVSVVLVKQHYMIDVLSSFVTTAFIYWLIGGVRPLRITR